MYQTTTLAEITAATAKQIGYLHILIGQKYAPEDRGDYEVFVDSGAMTKARASQIIGYLEKQPDVIEDVEVGLYLVDGVAYKVKRAVYGSGYLYACRWDEESKGFEKEAGAIRKIRANHRMTAEQAGPYGLAMGACAHCGRDLTDEESIARGLGPICAGKY